MALSVSQGSGKQRTLGWSLLKLFVITSPFLATAVVTLQGESLPVSYVALGMLAVVILPRIARTPVDNATLALAALYAALIASVAFNTLDWRGTAPPAGASAKNLKQLAAFGIMAVHFVTLRAALLRRGADEVARLLCLLAGVAFVISLYSFYEFAVYCRGGEPFLGFLRNSQSYSVAEGAGASGWAGLPRAKGFTPEPSMWGAFLLAPLAITLPFCKREHRGWRRNRLMVATFIAALVLTVSRTAWFGALLILLAFSTSSRTGFGRKLLALAAVLAAVALVPQIRSIMELLRAFSDLSAAARLQTQMGALRMFGDHPVFGVGLGGFALAFGRYAAAYVTNHGSEYFVTFNLYLTMLVESGVLGLGLFLAFLYLIMHSVTKAEAAARRRLDHLAADCCLATKLAFLGVLFTWLSVPAYNFSYLWLIMALGSVLPTVVSTPPIDEATTDSGTAVNGDAL